MFGRKFKQQLTATMQDMLQAIGQMNDRVRVLEGAMENTEKAVALTKNECDSRDADFRETHPLKGWTAMGTYIEAFREEMMERLNALEVRLSAMEHRRRK